MTFDEVQIISDDVKMVGQKEKEKQEKWDRHFLNLCLQMCKMSKDPSTQVGCVIVGPDLEIRSTGFNGFPRGVSDDSRLHDRDCKLQHIVHAEMNAICNAARVGVPLKGCTLYICATDNGGHTWGGAPCMNCTKHVIQAGIREVVCYPFKDTLSKWGDEIRQAHKIFQKTGGVLI